MLDQVNEEIEVNIQITRGIEFEIVKCSDVERTLAAKESDLTKTLYFSHFELTGLLTVAKFLENEIRLLEEKNNGLKNSMLAFVEGILEDLNSCNSALQVDIHRGSRENEKLVRDIDNMKTSLLSSFDCRDR